MDALTHEKQAGEFSLPHFFLFCLGSKWTGRCLPTLKMVFFAQFSDLQLTSARNILTDTLRHNVVAWR